MIHVIDAVMGRGKTRAITEWLESEVSTKFNDTNYLYVTPFLDEVSRVVHLCPHANFQTPSDADWSTKSKHLKHLISKSHNIATTHSLFSLITQEICSIIKQKRYILILDEVMECVTKYNSLSSHDIKVLINSGYISTPDTAGSLIWSDAIDNSYTGKFGHIRHLCLNRKLDLYGGKVLLEVFPIEFLKCFSEVYILTYLFEGSAMSSYLKTHGLTYEMLTVHDDKIKPWAEFSDENALKSEYKDLITIYDGSMNEIGIKQGRGCPLSSTWYDRQVSSKSKALSVLKGSTGNFFKKVAATNARHNAWTVFSDHKSRLKGDGYTRGWLPFNCRATNKHIEKRSLAYLCNVYHNPTIVQYFDQRGIAFSQDLYALSEMLQWIWRSQIRRYDPIHLFIPSERMRSLLYLWLDTRSTPELIRKLS